MTPYGPKGLARAGIHPLRASPQGFGDQRLPDAAIGPGHQDCLVCDVHNTLLINDARIVRAVDYAETATPGKWARAGRPVRPPAGVHTSWKYGKARARGDARVGLVTADLVSRAQAGDGDAFRELTEPHRRELQVHCYRMLGSFADAEDALQDTLLAAWQGLRGFEGRASIRTWLYRIWPMRIGEAPRRHGGGGSGGVHPGAFPVQPRGHSTGVSH